MSNNQNAALLQLQQAFKTADKDSDQLLNRHEFAKFVEIGYGKQCPPSMYSSVCARFKCDPQLGINWNTAKAIFLQANSANRANTLTRTNSTSNTNSATTSSHSSPDSATSIPTPHEIPKDLQPVTLRSTQSQPVLREHSATDSSGFPSVPFVHHRHLSLSNSLSNTADNDDRLHRRSTLQRRSSSRVSLLDQTPDASTMIVDMLESKTKTLQSQLLKERNKRKRNEQIMQTLLIEKDEYKAEAEQLRASDQKLKQELSGLRTQTTKFQQQVEDDRHVIRHLQQQRTSMKSERDESFSLLATLEKEHSMTVKKLKAKHKAELDALTNGLLQSLGAEAGKDITAVVKELKHQNLELKKTVNTLAESLARKQQSLLEALQAVDDTTMQEERLYRQQTVHKLKDSNEDEEDLQHQTIKLRFKRWNERRKSNRRRRRGSTGNILHSRTRNDSSSDHDFTRVPTASHPEMVDAPHSPNRVKATWIKQQMTRRRNANENENDVDEECKYPLKQSVDDASKSNETQVKEMQFLSQKLSMDVATKAQSISQLEMTNTMLIDQMQRMKQQVEMLQDEKNAFDQQNGK
eukprot:CAMPEP_0197039940 /NCGR_PEP_ID=MMETSP1384-20130603/16700_1 /TAXON_ID=29189 /ORGANISM="Ammonia sp." /LENGTH=577 /DNA_ID=CAMNT_0042470615 /DNA_START=40 /DNA_END=1773 /DNA_ORIENTATION=+